MNDPNMIITLNHLSKEVHLFAVIAHIAFFMSMALIPLVYTAIIYVPAYYKQLHINAQLLKRKETKWNS